jgi:hypothetical protein
VADRRRAEAQPGFGQRRCTLRQRGPGVFERRAGADVQHTVAHHDALELGHLADVDDIAEVAELLVDPQTDVGGPREHSRLWVRSTQTRELL